MDRHFNAAAGSHAALAWRSVPGVLSDGDQAASAHGHSHRRAVALHSGRSVDGDMPPEATCGAARVIDVEAEAITAEYLCTCNPRAGERLLFRSRNSTFCGPCFRKTYVAVTPDAARLLVERRVRTVGVDYLSIGPNGPEGDETHRILLGGGVWVIEGLRLGSVEPGDYELICLPLLIEGGDGAPARALLRK